MSEDKVYLKPNVVIEPLVDRWYAWTHLISPATAAMNIVERHMKIMDSYLMAPQIHAEAVQNPRMRGGPFMDLGGGRTEDVAALMKDTFRKREQMIAFARAVKQLDKLLAEEAKGAGLEALYARVPELFQL